MLFSLSHVIKLFAFLVVWFRTMLALLSNNKFHFLVSLPNTWLPISLKFARACVLWKFFLLFECICSSSLFFYWTAEEVANKKTYVLRFSNKNVRFVTIWNVYKNVRFQKTNKTLRTPFAMKSETYVCSPDDLKKHAFLLPVYNDPHMFQSEKLRHAELQCRNSVRLKVAGDVFWINLITFF